MAFNRHNLTIVTNNMKAGSVPSVWAYYNEDSDMVTSTNYFAEGRLTVGDQIYVNDVAFRSPELFRVSAKSADTQSATVVVSGAQIITNASDETLTTGTTLVQTVGLHTPVSLLVTPAANQTATFTASATSGNFITLSKDIAGGDGVHFVLTTATTLPAGLALATPYYVIDAGGDATYGFSSKKCRLSLTRGGSAVSITDAGTGVHTATVQKNFFMLADGAEGQRKIIKLKTDGGTDALVLPANLREGTLITAGDANDAMELQFTDGKWQLVANLGVAVS